MKVAVLGASPKPERISHTAVLELRTAGHRVFPVNPNYSEIDGIPSYSSLQDIEESIHTVTVYIAPSRIQPLIASIVSVKPKRVILNPGAESTDLKLELDSARIPWIEACTLVLLRSDSF